MIIVEYRVPMPFSPSEYQIGQLYTIAKKSKLESADSKNGVKVNVNEPYSNGPGGKGQYTNKTYYLANKIPDWMKRILPDSAAKLREEAWNAYPYSKNKFSNPLLEKLQLEIESHYLEGPPTLENVFQLSDRERASRSIVIIDLTCGQQVAEGKRTHKSARKSQTSDGHDDQSSSSSCCAGKSIPNNDVLAFNPLFREPLSDNWLEEYELAYENWRERGEGFVRNCKDGTLRKFGAGDLLEAKNDDDADYDGGGVMEKRLMTCYKLCRVNFPVWPFQTKVEQFIQQYCRDTIMESHKQTWLWQDEWTGMSVEQIREMEEETQRQLLSMMRREASPLN